MNTIVDVRCPHCNTILEVPDDLLGQIVSCPFCQNQIKLSASSKRAQAKKIKQNRNQKKTDMSCRDRFFVFVLIIVMVIWYGSYCQNKIDEEGIQEVKEKQEQIIIHYNDNRDSIISEIKKALHDEKYQVVVSKSEKYLVAGDENLKRIYNQACEKMLLTELETLPKYKIVRARDIYKKLLNIVPDNLDYKTNFDNFSSLCEKESQRRKQRQNEINIISKHVDSALGKKVYWGKDLSRVIEVKIADEEVFTHYGITKSVYIKYRTNSDSIAVAMHFISEDAKKVMEKLNEDKSLAYIDYYHLIPYSITADKYGNSSLVRFAWIGLPRKVANRVSWHDISPSTFESLLESDGVFRFY